MLHKGLATEKGIPLVTQIQFPKKSAKEITYIGPNLSFGRMMGITNAAAARNVK